MFTPRDQMMALAAAGGAGGFGLRTTPPSRAASPASAPRLPAYLNGLERHLTRHWRPLAARIERWFAARDLAPDLAEDIGSACWFRGFGTMLALGAAAVFFWPDFAPLQAAPLTALDSAATDEFRVQGIRPLAYGADNGQIGRAHV